MIHFITLIRLWIDELSCIKMKRLKKFTVGKHIWISMLYLFKLLCDMQKYSMSSWNFHFYFHHSFVIAIYFSIFKKHLISLPFLFYFNLLVTSAKNGLTHDIQSHLNSQTKHLNFGPRISDLTRKQCHKYFYSVTLVASTKFVMVFKWWIFQEKFAFKKHFLCEGKQKIF
jgi:hypothetical protein